jgi:MHS family proline/betaine transporter-like MFS transporter
MRRNEKKGNADNDGSDAMSAVTEQSGPSVPALSGRQTLVAATASLFGWGLDLFDLFILLFVAPIVGKLFFPANNPMLSLAGAYASFAVTLLIRPLGSALFGSYADRKGRRMAMMIAVTGVGLSTASFGLLPTVVQIGWAATALFLILRLIQGVFVGGVVASSHTIGTETVPERWRGLMSGAVGGGGSALGGLLASLVFYIVSTLAPGEEFAAWGWRVMFFSGLLTAVIGLILFRNLEESPIFQALQKAKAARHERAPTDASPLKTLFSGKHLPVFLVNLLLTIGAGSGYYLTSGYLPTFFNLVNKLPNNVSSLILVGVALAAAAGALWIGHLSQRFGRKTVLVVMGALRIVAFPLLFLAMGNTDSIVALTIYSLLIAFIANGSYGPLLIFLNERFPTALRASGTGLSWNVGFALGGMMPTFVSLVSKTPQQLPMTLAVFITALSVLFVIGAIIVPETKGNLRRVE